MPSFRSLAELDIVRKRLRAAVERRWNIMQKEERKKTRAEGQVTIEQSSGNVFADLAFKDPEEMLAKAQLA